ncbi:hypothetical protein IJD44_02995 [bacterium]|nr:hypothetical protein [bacterium]
MLYRTIEIDELIEDKDTEQQMIDLMENNNSHLKLVALKKHAQIPTHISQSDVCIFVTEGKIEIKFLSESNCDCSPCDCDIQDKDNDSSKKYVVKKEQFFLFEKNVLHSIKALKDSTFLLIKI